MKKYLSAEEMRRLSAAPLRFAEKIFRLAQRKRVQPNDYANGLVAALCLFFASVESDDFAFRLHDAIGEFVARNAAHSQVAFNADAVPPDSAVN